MNRNKIYESKHNGAPLDKTAASELCSALNFWGMMVEKGHLPIWVFKGASGPSENHYPNKFRPSTLFQLNLPISSVLSAFWQNKNLSCPFITDYAEGSRHPN
ncbi:hypothetical protein [Neobacillus notoginsengisoli]|uniref:hypothetical protein n=1 Tax=Neobacillus notoginsengisoli TaxID=1578198 RepID=UPI00115EBDC8|nr:hypothetical protein [Neobacillus notoginsengisoli]